jgi:hypothetical protein
MQGSINPLVLFTLVLFLWNAERRNLLAVYLPFKYNYPVYIYIIHFQTKMQGLRFQFLYSLHELDLVLHT